MRQIVAMGNMINILRPVVFLAGEDAAADNWQAKVTSALADLDTGTIVNPRVSDEAERHQDHTLWSVTNLWLADVVAIWFRAGSAQIETAFTLGQHLARYSVGSGPRRLVVGSSKDYMGLPIIRGHFDVAMSRIDVAWKIQFNNSLDSFTEDVKRAVKYAASVR